MISMTNTNVCGIEVSEIVKQAQVIRAINSSKSASACYDPDAKVTMFRACIVAKVGGGSRLEQYERATKIMGIINPVIMYDSVTDWGKELERTWRQSVANHDKLKANQDNCYGFILVQDLRRIPLEARRLPGQKQLIQESELLFIYRRITAKILKRSRTEGRDYVILSRKYWDKISEDYHKTTGRRLNNHKLGRITTLLSDYGLISRNKRWKDGRQKANLYRLGEFNRFYGKVYKDITK